MKGLLRADRSNRLRVETKWRKYFGDGFAGDDFVGGFVGAGYSPLSQDALDVDMVSGTMGVA